MIFELSKNSRHVDNDSISVKLIIKGKVQGVYFRANMQKVAKQNSVVGWVRNLPDGNVEALLEGYQANVNHVVQWSKIGPENAKVDDVIVARTVHLAHMAFQRRGGDMVDQRDRTARLGRFVPLAEPVLRITVEDGDVEPHLGEFGGDKHGRRGLPRAALGVGNRNDGHWHASFQVLSGR